MKKNLLIIFIGIIIVSCDKRISGPIIEADVNFSFVNSKGEDLLNPKNSSTITEENVDVYILRNGSKILLFQGKLDASKFFKIRNNLDKYWLQMYFDLDSKSFKGDKITQYLRFKDGSEIEIIGEFNSNRQKNKILQKIWIDGVERPRSEVDSTGENPIVIVK